MASNVAHGVVPDMLTTDDVAVETRQRSTNDEKHPISPTVTSTLSSGDSGSPPEATAEEIATLRKVAGHVPGVSYVLCLVEFAERASYYGCQQVFSNFIQFPLPEGGNGAGAPPKGTQMTAGALNQGLAISSAITLLFAFLAYTIPILGGYIADARLGKFKTICIGVFIVGIAHIIMVFSALPSVLQADRGMVPFTISLIILAFGSGMFKSNIAPTIMDQYQHKYSYVKVLEKTGERVIVDPEATISRMMLTFYALINVGAFFGVATSYAEKRIGFWLAYLLPTILYLLCPIVLVFAYKRTVKVPPKGSLIGQVVKLVGISIKKNGILKVGRKGYLDAAKPSRLEAEGIHVPWNDKFVDEVAQTFEACQIFLFFPIYYLNDGGIGNISTSQASSMITNGVPNDLIGNINPLTIIVAIPFMNYVLYPALRKYNISFPRIARITFGFILAAISGAIGAILQWYIYKKSPCGNMATGCTVGDGVAPISVWVQVPYFALGALSECFCLVTAYELSYSRSPSNMTGLVMGIFLFMNAIASAISEAVTPALRDPFLIWPFAAPAIVGFVVAIWFYFLYRHLDDNNISYVKEAEETPGLHVLADHHGSNQTHSDPEKH